MLSFLWSLGVFIVVLGILVVVYEWGYFYVVWKCGVYVECFLIGFGKLLWWCKSVLGIEYVIVMILFGGYVCMLDGRVDDVFFYMVDKVFNNKYVLKCMVIIVVGFGVNFVFVFLVFWLMFLVGL